MIGRLLMVVLARLLLRAARRLMLTADSAHRTAGRLLRVGVPDQAAPARPLAASDEAVASPPLPSYEGAGWHAMPGQVIELASTGFQIRMVLRVGYAPYHLFDPEGRAMASGAELPALKCFAEMHAAWRAEFTEPSRAAWIDPSRYRNE